MVSVKLVSVKLLYSCCKVVVKFLSGHPKVGQWQGLQRFQGPMKCLLVTDVCEHSKMSVSASMCTPCNPKCSTISSSSFLFFAAPAPVYGVVVVLGLGLGLDLGFRARARLPQPYSKVRE